MKKLILLAFAFCVAGFSASAQSCADLSVSFTSGYTVTIKNIGNAESVACKGLIEREWKSTGTTGTTLNDITFDIPALGAGKSITKSTNGVSKQLVTVSIDSNDKNSECREDNNTAVK